MFEHTILNKWAKQINSIRLWNKKPATAPHDILIQEVFNGMSNSERCATASMLQPHRNNNTGMVWNEGGKTFKQHRCKHKGQEVRKKQQCNEWNSTGRTIRWNRWQSEILPNLLKSCVLAMSDLQVIIYQVHQMIRHNHYKRAGLLGSHLHPKQTSHDS